MRRKPRSIVGSSPWSKQGLSDGVTPARAGAVESCPAGKPGKQATEPWPPRLGNPCSPLLLHGPNLTSRTLVSQKQVELFHVDSHQTVAERAGGPVRSPRECPPPPPPSTAKSASLERDSHHVYRQGCWKN